MGSTTTFEEPTMTKIDQTFHQEEEEEDDDEVGDLERKTSSFRREKRTVSTDSSTLTITTSGSSSSSSSSSDSADIFCTDVPNGKELGVDQSNAAEAENSEAPELPEQDKDLGFHGEHNDEKNDSVYFDGEEGLESNGVAGAEPDAPESHTDDNLNGERSQPDTENASTAIENEKSREIEEIRMRDSPEDPKAVHQLAADVIEEEVDTEVDDYGVEKVLENQETHDLYCPNCNSCITKRVILKRRKRKVRHVLGDAKRGRVDVSVGGPSSSPGDDAQATDHDPQVASPDDKEPCLFRCLSCFSIFFPTGEGFKLFRFTKDKKEIETPLLSQQTATGKNNWFYSIFASKNKETPAEEGGERPSASQVNSQGNLDSSPENARDSAAEDPSKAQDGVQGGATTLIPATSGSKVNPPPSDENGTPSTSNGQSKTEVPVQQVDTNLTQATSGSQVNPPPSDENGSPSNANGQSKTEVPVQQVDTNLTQDLKPVDTESHDKSKSVANEGETTKDGLGFLASLAGKDNNLSNGDKPSDEVSFSAIQPHDHMEVRDKVTVEPDELKTHPELPTIGGSESNVSSTTKPGEKLEIISDPKQVEPKHPLGPFNDLTANLLPDRNETQPHVEVGEDHKLEILKSIVYGGLVQSITSLGVTSSAAGSGATTLNIFVLGLANLVGGIIVIAHNLQELREESPRRTTTGGNQINEQEEDRYKRLLGRRENFRLHAIVAILSFIIVGLIPPVVYGFSFRKSDNRDYKAVAVLGASLVCIILLAIAKAHVKTPRGSYLKSLLYYTTIAISASGISYFVGDIVSQLLEKYGWTDGSENPAELMLPLLGRKAGLGYSSY